MFRAVLVETECLKLNVFKMNSFFLVAQLLPVSVADLHTPVSQFSLQTFPLEISIFPWLHPPARGPPPTLLSATWDPPVSTICPYQIQHTTERPRCHLDDLWALQTPTAHMRKSVAPQRSQTSEELLRSFHPGLGSHRLPGSQERPTGSRPCARGFLGQVVAALARPYTE